MLIDDNLKNVHLKYTVMCIDLQSGNWLRDNAEAYRNGLPHPQSWRDSLLHPS